MTLKFLAIVQARMSSTRLPGKVLRHLNGKPILGHLLDRINHSELFDRIVVATSDESSDEAIEAYCNSRRIACVRGSLQNTKERFLRTLELHPCRYFCRINADSPVYDASLARQAYDIIQSANSEIVTNALRRTFPVGQGVEVLDTELFREMCRKYPEPDEHVTSVYYKNPTKFKIDSFEARANYSDVRLAVDTQKDFDIMESMLAKLPANLADCSWQELAERWREEELRQRND